MALERAAAFTDVVALGLRVEARRMVTRAEANGGFSSDADEKAVRTKAARLMHTAGSLMATAKDSNTVPTSGVADVGVTRSRLL